MGFLPLSTLSIILYYKQFVYWRIVQRIKSFQDFFVQFAGRPCERKNVERLDFLKFSPGALVYGEAR